MDIKRTPHRRSSPLRSSSKKTRSSKPRRTRSSARLRQIEALDRMTLWPDRVRSSSVKRIGYTNHPVSRQDAMIRLVLSPAELLRISEQMDAASDAADISGLLRVHLYSVVDTVLRLKDAGFPSEPSDNELRDIAAAVNRVHVPLLATEWMRTYGNN